MPNPPQQRRGPCETCTGYGGPAGIVDAVICLRPEDSGKTICRMPEVGCFKWRPIASDESNGGED